MIFSVQKRKKRVNGVLKESRVYWLRYRIGSMPCDKWVSLGVTDKAAAHSEAKKFLLQKERELAGLALPKSQVEAAAIPLPRLISEYADELKARGRDAKYVKGTETRLTLVASECRWERLGDASADSFMHWRRNQTHKAKTLNDYLTDVFSFLKWQVKLDRLASNPLAAVEKVSRNEEEEEVRRAFTKEEFDRLCEVSGPRALIYRVTLFAGLRRAEVKQLQWGDLLRTREGKTFWKLRASTTKNGKEAKQRVPSWLVKQLEAFRPPGAKLSASVFPSIPRMPRFYRDLEAAGIPRVDERGHVAVFHSLRHTLGTWLWQTGADPRVIQDVMRHSSLAQTAQRYTDTAVLAVNEALEALPGFFEPDEKVIQIGAQISAFEGHFVSQAVAGAEKKSKSEPAGIEWLSRALAGLVAGCQMVRAAGFEPATPSV
jgi:integrase